MVVTVCNSEEEFQALVMRLAARVLLPGTGWIAFTCVFSVSNDCRK